MAEQYGTLHEIPFMSRSILTLTIPPGHPGGQQNFCAQMPGGPGKN